MKQAYHFNPETLLYTGISEAYKVAGYDEYILPQFATWSGLPAHDKETEQCKFNSEKSHWLVELKLIAVTVYNKQTRQPKQFDDITFVTDDYTPEKPITEWDEWTNNTWVTNQSQKYIHDYDQVDNVRRGLYSQMCDPLISEANIKRLQGNEAEAKELEAQALAAWQKIHDENPWPEQPIN